QFVLDIQEESDGVKKLFEILCPLIDIIINDKVLFWDELESSLHPCIVKEILRFFKFGISNSKSQLIFTTHDINLLDLSFFRRDQIWFTELDKSNRSSDLYSLNELKNVRKDENIQKGYISGKYGAIPCLSPNSADSLNMR
ncbi:MAG: ATP-binding protein, partial [Youngiibacter sp.]|nr:ATP-binding protein [Youngiibacter sp.]